MGASYQDENGEKWYETALVLDGTWQWKTRSKTLDGKALVRYKSQVISTSVGINRGDAGQNHTNLEKLDETCYRSNYKF